MQLTKSSNLKSLLTSATCALLGTHATTALAESGNDWQFDTALMVYSETDRVSAGEAIIAAKKQYGNDQVLNLKLTVDSLTGASANGAVSQPNVQTFTRPSGKGQYQIQAGDTPLDDTFRDTRLQFTGQWTQPIAEQFSLSVGGNASKEYDYMSLSVNASIARDFNLKNTTLAAGFSYAFDRIEPEGGIPKALFTMPTETKDNDPLAFDNSRIGSSEDKNTVDLLFGLTQVINRQMLVQLNYSYSKVDGYQTDPFKVLSVVNNQGSVIENIYENRPDSRTKHAFYAQGKYHFDNSVLDASYRYMTDDWEIDSHTIDLRYYLPLTAGHYIEPHVRVYQQSAADFYQPYLENQAPLPAFASADYRVGEMTAYTLGVKYGVPLQNGQKLAFRLEYYTQSPENAGFDEIGLLQEQDLYPSIDAIIAQVSYSF